MTLFASQAWLGSDSSEVTIDAAGITVSKMFHTVAAETGSTDTLSGVTPDADMLAIMGARWFPIFLRAKTGHTIRLEHNDTPGVPGLIRTTDDFDFDITDQRIAMLVYDPSQEAWMGIGMVSGSGGELVGTSGTQTITDKTLTSPNINSPVIKEIVNDYASGAINVDYGHAYLTAGSPTTYTLADPTNVVDDGKELTICSKTAHAHKIDNSAGGGFDGGGASLDFANFAGGIGDNIVLMADAGVWYVKSTRNVTIAAS